MTYAIIFGVLGVLLVAMIIFSATSYNRMLRTYRKYDNEFVYCNMTGLEFTAWAIDSLGLKTKIMLVEKELEECYIPSKDVVCISKHTAETSSVSSICVSCHELGHAVQNKNQKSLFVLQSCLKGLSKICAFLLPFLLIFGIAFLFVPDRYDLGVGLLIGTLVAIFVMFFLKIVTIPTEIQASRIAYKFLKEKNVLKSDELKHGKKVLDAAIGTYVASLFFPIIKFFRGIGRLFDR